jgi:hypothetical protein
MNSALLLNIDVSMFHAVQAACNQTLTGGIT